MRIANGISRERKAYLFVLVMLCIIGLAIFFLRSESPESDRGPQNESFPAYIADNFDAEEEGSAQKGELNHEGISERAGSENSEEIAERSGETASHAANSVAASDSARGDQDEAIKPSRGQAGGAGTEEESKPVEEPKLKVSSEEISAWIEAFRPFVRRCYEETLVDFPDAAGTISLAFTMESQDGKGRVFMSEIGENTTLFDDALHDCLLYQISEIDFDLSTPDGHQVYIRRSFIFEPE